MGEIKMRKINQRNYMLKQIKEKQMNAESNILKLKLERKTKQLKLKNKCLELKKFIKKQKNVDKYDRAVNNHEKHLKDRINRLKIHHNIVKQRLAENKENTKDKENIKPESDKQNNLSYSTKNT